MFEADFQTLIASVIGAGKVFWDTAPDTFAMNDRVAYLQQVGGRASWYMDKQSMPDHKHARIMVTIYTKSRAETAPLARAVEDAIALSDFVSEPYGAAVAIMEDELNLYGTQQQFGIWYRDPPV